MMKYIETIGGMILVFVLGTLAIALLFAGIYKVYRKFQSVKKSDGLRRSWLTLLAFTLLVVFWGLMVGFTSGLISQFLPIIFLYPAVMGINSGRMIVDVV